MGLYIFIQLDVLFMYLIELDGNESQIHKKNIKLNENI